MQQLPARSLESAGHHDEGGPGLRVANVVQKSPDQQLIVHLWATCKHMSCAILTVCCVLGRARKSTQCVNCSCSTSVWGANHAKVSEMTLLSCEKCAEGNSVSVWPDMSYVCCFCCCCCYAWCDCHCSCSSSSSSFCLLLLYFLLLLPLLFLLFVTGPGAATAAAAGAAAVVAAVFMARDMQSGMKLFCEAPRIAPQ